MAAPIKPALTQAFGNESWLWVPAIADIAEPTVTEIEANTGFNLSCSVFGEQEGATAETEKVTLPRLLCERETFQVNGATSYSMADLQVSFNPQADAGTDGKKAWEALDDYAKGFLVRRQGLDSKTVVATGDFVDVIPAQLGVKVPTRTGTDASAVFTFQVAAAITGAPAWNVEVQAA